MRTRTSLFWRLLVAGFALLVGLSLGAATALAEESSGQPRPEGAPGGATVVGDLITIPVTPGGAAVRMRVAVPDTHNLGEGDPHDIGSQIADTIRHGLELVGHFQVIGPEAYFFDPALDGMTASTINFQNWYNVGAESVVKTAFRVAANQVRLDFRLFDVSTGQQVQLQWEPVTVPINGVLPEVYRFLNALMLHYLGTPGPFGSRLAVSSPGRHGTRQIFLMNMDGTGVTPYTDNATINMMPAWGPGGQVMYTSYLHQNPDLFIGPNNERRLSSRPGMNTGASLSPDGTRIALTLTRDERAEVYVLDLEGNILTRLTNHPANDLSPTWSPDGSRIAFVSDRAGSPQIYVMNADGTNVRRVTFAGNYNTEPAWSPRSNLIAFTGRDSRNRFDIFTVDPDTSVITRLTQDSGRSEGPTWSPDGRFIAFSSTRGGGQRRIWMMTAEGQYPTLVTREGSGWESPAWEPAVPRRSAVFQ